MSERIKYPRTPHLPWSENKSSDDKTLKDVEHFRGKEVVVTEKMDGENTTLYSDYVHARSLDSKSHPSRNWVKAFQGSIGHNIPEGWRVCGENLYAKHSIHYKNLKSYFYTFSIWDDENVCLTWDDTIYYAELFGAEVVPVLYRGIFDEDKIKSLFKEGSEGYVVRLTDCFSYKDFQKSVAKFVRKNHVQTDEHWMFKEIEVNNLETK